jgi:signal transduction histidine kinase/DNA-binding response OmpR family regulator
MMAVKLIMLLVFWLTFSVIGAWMQEALEAGIGMLTGYVDRALAAGGVNEALHSLVVDGIFNGVGSVLSFVPVIAVMFFFLSILEDSGYMARVAFVMDKLLRKIGLSGRSIVPMLVGFGCTVPGVMASRTLPSERDRKMTILLTPFMSCTAKLPIYGFFTAAFFPKYGGLVMVALYFAFRIVRNFNGLRNRINVEKQLTEYKLVFFTNISHEFRTPLTLIQGALEKIQRVTDIPRELIYPLKTMDKSTQRMLRLINQLLEFRKMQNNKLALSLEETDVISFLYEIFLSFGDVAEQKNMNFRFLPSVPSYKMFIDKGNLDKVTYNLLSNAFKYTPSNGTIILSVNVDEGKQTLQIQVSDTGVGIPKEKQNELFKRFMQSNFSGDSIGVGLHLSHELVQVHKGTIEYKDNEGGGSVFTVCIPTDKTVYSEKDFLVPGNVLLKEADGHAHHLLQLSEELPDPEKMAAPLNKRKVLIIEDDNDIREFLREEIGAYFEVEVAADGTSGFEKARTYDADLIICDVLMPGMTGFEVTRKLKTDFDTSHIPIILLTALNSPEKHLEGIEAGADAYIAKPFSVKLLLARVFRLIEQRDKLREKFSNEPGIVRSAMCTTDRDKEFADRLAAILEQNLARPEFSIDEFAQLMKLGRTVFYRKLRGVTGYSPNEYLRVVRMKKAAELLLSEDNLTVAEVSYKVGISDPFYFSKCFKAQFGVAPSVYQRGVNNEIES